MWCKLGDGAVLTRTQKQTNNKKGNSSRHEHYFPCLNYLLSIKEQTPKCLYFFVGHENAGTMHYLFMNLFIFWLLLFFINN